jgi:hypothetical protein
MPAAVPTHYSEAYKAVRRDSLLTVGVDFHGVICEHPEGSKGITEMTWPEVPGAIDWLKDVTDRFNVHVVSARFSRPGREGAVAIAAARSWLAYRGIPMAWMASPYGMPRILLTPFKPACVLWVDDRAFCFRGQFPLVEEIEGFKPWNR